MGPSVFGAAIISGMLLSRLAELRIHRRNYDVLKRAGAEELAADVMRRYYLLTLLVIPAAMAEGLSAGHVVQPNLLVAGLVAALAGLVLRFWAIQSLGPFWSMRCLAVPGARLVGRGPYRYTDNPEYLSRILEGLGLCAVLGAPLTAAGWLLVTVVYVHRVIGTEQRQLLEVAHLPAHRQGQGEVQPS